MSALTIAKLIDNGYGPEWLATTPGADLRSAQQNSPYRKKKVGYTSAAGPLGNYGADLVYAKLLPLAVSSTTTIDLTAVQDVSGATQSWARLKAVWMLLLGLDDNGGITAQASSVTVGAGASNGHLLFLANASDKYVLTPGRKVAVEDYSGTGAAVTSLLKTIDIINADASNAGLLALALAGSLT